MKINNLTVIFDIVSGCSTASSNSELADCSHPSTAVDLAVEDKTCKST